MKASHISFFVSVKDIFSYLVIRVFSGFLSFLSFPVVNRCAAAFAFVLHHVLRYRRATTLGNLQRCFPGKSDQELKSLLSRVYRNLSCVLFETIKAFSVDQEGIYRRLVPPDAHQVSEFQAHFRGAILVTAHLSNWEWCGYCLTAILKGQGIAVYKPLKNKKVDAFVREQRKVSRLRLVSMQDVVKSLAGSAGKENYILMIADQSPSPDNAHWEPFFGIRTPFFKGPATIAVRYDIPVFFLYMERIGRSRYHMFLEPMCMTPAAHTPEEITRMYAERLEQQIRKNPADWLWTHRRWKHAPPSADHQQA